MAEKKLSEELRHCLEDDACGDCQYHEPETKFICKDLLQKAYEVVERYEKMSPCKVGDILFYPYINEEGEKRIEELEIADISTKLFQTQDENWSSLEEIGQEVFLTRQEAEGKLAETEGKK